MSKIRDLVQIPEKKPVPFEQIYEALGPQKAAKIKDFVITEEIAKHYGDVLKNISHGMGQGYWVTGFWGCGKTYFLSYLGLLLTEPASWEVEQERIQELMQFRKRLDEQDLLVVPIYLAEEESLLYALYERAEIDAQKAGLTLEISSVEKQIEHFRRKWEDGRIAKDRFFEVTGLNQTLLDKMLAEKSEVLAKKYLEFEYPEGNYQDDETFKKAVYPTVGDGIDLILKQLHEQKKDGLVLLIDELSQYLDNRKKAGKMGDDLFVLQVLGERCDTQKLWVLCAMQQHLRELIAGDEYDRRFTVKEEGQKVRDRFRQLQLTRLNTEEIVAKRVAKKLPEAEDRIKDIYSIFVGEFGNELGEEMPRDKFLRCYPFHPQTVDSMVRATDRLSRTRTVIQQLSEILMTSGDKDDTDIVIPYSLFDSIFTETPPIEVATEPVLSMFHRKYYEDLLPEIERIFEDAADRELVKRLIKSLIMLQIAFDKPVPTDKLARINLASIGAGSCKLNYRNVRRLLDKLYVENRARDIRREEIGTEDGEKLYQYLLPTEAVGAEPEVMARKGELTDSERQRVLEYLLRQSPDLFPGSMFKDNRTLSFSSTAYNVLLDIWWRGTERPGYTVLRKITTVNDPIPTRPEENIDYAVIIGSPLEENPEVLTTKVLTLRDKAGEDINLFWVPRIFDAKEKDDFDRYVAIFYLLGEKYSSEAILASEQEREIRGQLQNQEANLRPAIERMLVNSYKNGAIYRATETFENFSGYTETRKIIEDVLQELLTAKYPDHPQFTHKIRPSNTNSLINSFIIPMESDSRTHDMESVAEPLGIMATSPGKFVLDHQSPYVTYLLEKCEKRVAREKSAIYKDMRVPNDRMKLGLQSHVVDVLLATLLVCGLVKGIKRDDTIFTWRDLEDAKNLKLIDKVQKAELLDVPTFELAKQIAAIWVPEEVKDLERSGRNQETLWYHISTNLGALNEARERREKDIDELIKPDLLNSKKGDYFVELESKLKTILKPGIISPSLDSFEGCTGVINSIKDTVGDVAEFERLVSAWSNVEKFFSEGYDQLVLNRYRYLESSEIPAGEKKLGERRDNLLSQLGVIDKLVTEIDVTKKWLDEAAKWKEDYAHAYISYHDKYYKATEEDIEKIKGLSQYGVLEKLAGIPQLELGERLQKVKDIMEEMEEKHRCPRAEGGLSDVLKERYMCDRCGKSLTVLATAVEGVDTEELKNSLDEFVGEVTGVINGIIVREKGAKYKISKNDLISNVDKVIKTLKEILPSEHIVVRASQILTGEYRAFKPSEIDNIKEIFGEKLRDAVKKQIEGKGDNVLIIIEF